LNNNENDVRRGEKRRDKTFYLTIFKTYL